MRKCKEEFKEFERQDVNYQKDFKHISQKIKKLEDKLEKVEKQVIVQCNETYNSFVSTLYVRIHPKLKPLWKRARNPLMDNIPKLQKLLLDEEKILDEITKSSKGGLLSFLLIYF